MKAVRLKTNYRKDPIGIDTDHFHFSWNCEGGIRQKSFQLIIKDEDGRQVFDSSKIDSARMSYDLKITLNDQTRCFWHLILWDENGKQEESEAAFFETGLGGKWKARWITTGRVCKKERLSGEYFRRQFVLKKKVKKVRLYASACGTYSAYINSQRLSGVLAPGSSEYGKHIYYQTYDVTKLLKEENTLDFTLLDGWYMGKLGYLNETNHFGNMRKLIAQLVITYEDETKEYICSDESFKCCYDGPILYSDLKDGEIYDANRIPSYDKHAIVCDHKMMPEAAPQDLIEEQEHFTPDLLITPSGKKVLDFHQNMAGYICFKANWPKESTITIQMGEVLDHGEFSRNTLLEQGRPDQIAQKIVYTSNGQQEYFHPEGFYSGFRYALIEGIEEIDPAAFEGVAIYSPLEFTSTFECSNKKIEQFHRNTLWSLKSNFVDVPTDCPQREKSGWDGDAQVFLPTALYMADVSAFFKKWLVDLADCQRKDGRIENVSPSAHRFAHREALGGAAGWADAAIIIPYRLWKNYGDESFISDNLKMMLGWKSYVEKAAKDKREKHATWLPFLKHKKPYYVEASDYENYVIESGSHWGEWLEPDVDSFSEIDLPKPELTTAYAAYSMGLLGEMLQKIGREKEAEECFTFSKHAKQAYSHYFIKEGQALSKRQSAMVRPLALDLLKEEDREKIARDLAEDVRNRNYKVGTGFLSTPFVLSVLVSNGYVKEAYRMLENEEVPGWLAMVKGGATSIWETYVMYDEEGHPLGHSMNHYSPGAVCAFLYDTVCGIRIDSKNRFVIAPVPGGTLDYAKAEYLSPYGKVSSSWEKKEGKIFCRFDVPANCTALILLPDGRKEKVSAGAYEFVV